jgi:hypothetical protein
MFPTLSATNLEGQRFQLPNDLKGELNIVIIAFKREHQELVEEWVPFLTILVQNNPSLAFYELPTLNSSYLLIRWMINGGMRSGISDKEARERTITLYTNKKEIKRQLNIPNEETIYIILIDKNGRIIWRTNDKYTEEKAQELEKVLEKYKTDSS